VRQQGIEDPIFLRSFLLDRVEIDRLKEKADAGTLTGNELPVVGGNA
jgi:hypothetical protein